MADGSHLSSNVRSCSPPTGRCERCQALQQPLLLLQFALPDDSHTKAESPKSHFLPGITCLIGPNLVIPPFSVGSRKSRQRARLVTMPKASVHEDAPSSEFICDIRSARKIFGAYAKSNSGAMEKGSHCQFGCRVTLADGPHSFRRFGCRSRTIWGRW